MGIDQSTFWTIVAIVGAAIVGGWANHWFAARPKLYTFISHTAALKAKVPNGAPLTIHTHSVVVRNSGRKSATDVRLGHTTLPDYSIYPSMQVDEQRLQDGSTDLVFPVLRPHEQFTISYLYYPPVVYHQINTHVKSDEGAAKILQVMPARQPSKPVVYLGWSLMFLGSCTLIYMLVTLFTKYV